MFCGIAKAGFSLGRRSPQATGGMAKQKGMHGEMQYMENHFDKRLDPRLLVDNAKSVISLGLNYFTDQKQADPLSPAISKYAYGADYHHVIKEKAKAITCRYHKRKGIGEVNGRAFVDSAPSIR